jgi:hypothetical protein
MDWSGARECYRMAVMTFDTLKFANTLKAAGVPDKQAEAEATALADVLAVNFKELTTKADLAELRTELKNDLRETEQRLNAKIDLLRSDSNARIDALSAKMDSHQAKVDGQITLGKWMLGLSISLNIAVLVRLFLIRSL